MKTTAFAFFIVLGIMLGGCDDGDAPGVANVSLKMKASTSLSKTSSSGRSMATGLVFSQVLIGVTELEFETLEDQLEEENEANGGEDNHGGTEDEEIEFEGNFVVDLIHGTSTPDFGVAEILPGLYEEIEVEISPILEGGKSVIIAFEIPRQDADALRVEYSYSGELEIEIERDAGFHFDGGSLHQMLVLFNLDLLFGNIDFSQAVADADGIIRIHAASNADLASLIMANFHAAFEAGEDHDGDDHIDED